MTDLSPLKLYKYSSVDKSPTSKYILTPYWNFLTTLFPLWVAPNLITLTGLSFIIINIITILIVMPDLVGPGPSWLYASCALGLFMYQSFDNVDGKQARRTKSSSPLGELFDHGIDSLNCTLGGIVLNACLGFGSTPRGAVIVIVSAWPMFISSWEQFHTGTLYLGFFNGPTEGILIAVACMLLSAVYGPQFWANPAYVNFGGRWLLGDVKTETLFMVNVFMALFAVHIPACILNVKAAKRLSMVDTLSLTRQWAPLIIFTGSAFGWLLSPRSSLLQDNHLVLFGFFLCLIFGRMTTKIILAHLLHQPFPIFAGILIPLIIGTISINTLRVSPAAELQTLYVLTFVTVLIYSRWAITTIQQFTNYLGISCLTIPYKS